MLGIMENGGNDCFWRPLRRLRLLLLVPVAFEGSPGRRDEAVISQVVASLQNAKKRRRKCDLWRPLQASGGTSRP